MLLGPGVCVTVLLVSVTKTENIDEQHRLVRRGVRLVRSFPDVRMSVERDMGWGL